MHYSARLSLLPALVASAFPLYAADTTDSEHYTATLPTVTVVGQSDTSVLKGYINYDEAPLPATASSSKKRRKPSIRSTSKKTKTTARTI